MTRIKSELLDTRQDVLHKLNLWSSRGYNLNNFFIKIVPVDSKYVIFYDSDLEDSRRKYV
jgi:hypothetical protein